MQNDLITKYKRDAVCAIVSALLAIFLYSYLIPNYIGESDVGGMSPQFFPQVGAIIIGFFSFCLFITSWLSIRSIDQYSEPDNNSTERAVTHAPEFKYPIIVMGVLVLFCIAFEKVGYIFTAPITITCLMFTFGQRRPVILVVVSLLVSALLFVAFEYGLSLPLS